MLRTLVLLMLAALLAPPVAFGADDDVAPPDEAATIGRRVPDVALTGDDGRAFHLRDLAGKPLVINPVFTRCPYACPAMTSSLHDALSAIGDPGAAYQVVTVSFDPADTTEDLRAYRERLGLPAGWRVATAAPAALDSLLTALDFRYAPMVDGGFAHANVVVVLTPAQHVSGYVHGIAYEEADVRRALLTAVAPPSLVRQFRPLIIAAAVLSLLVTLVVLLTTRRRPQPAA